jgi:hypothetical protein
MRTVKMSGRVYHLDPRRVEGAVSGMLPEPIREHFVIIGGRRWPPKQVMALVTGLDRADFTTHQARRILTRLGFTAARAGDARTHPARSARPVMPSSQASAESPAEPPSLAEALRPFIGQWVAVRDDEVLAAAATPRQVVAWLAEHGQRAQSMFCVPGSEQAITGAAPQ